MKAPPTPSHGKRVSVRLEAPGWTAETRRALEQLIRRGAGQQLPVVFDFDNTLVCGDIGEATLAVLTRDGILRPETVPECASPVFLSKGGRKIGPRSRPDLTAYYEAFLEATAHQKEDRSRYANGYIWAAQALAGLTPLQVVEATQRAFACSTPGVQTRIEVTPGKTSYPAPYLYPEMVELIAALRRHRFDVWIVSASNVWSVRWMVRNVLEPALRKCSAAARIPPEHVIGVSTLLRDSRGRLYKDSALVGENGRYAALDPAVLKSFRLTAVPQFPPPAYGGKVACIWEAIGRAPFLGIGDSPGDLPMLSFCQNRLWISRPDKPGYHAAFLECARRCGSSWMIQRL